MLQLALNRATPARTVRASAQFGEDCGDAIPLLRQQTIDGCETCVSCQGLREARR
ncbi:TraR/DksA C4-type zinc finger protein [Pseudomonas sp. GG8]